MCQCIYNSSDFLTSSIQSKEFEESVFAKN